MGYSQSEGQYLKYEHINFVLFSTTSAQNDRSTSNQLEKEISWANYRHMNSLSHTAVNPQDDIQIIMLLLFCLQLQYDSCDTEMQQICDIAI